MNLKNYTSSVPAERSVSRIEALLIEAGAEHIVKTYDSATRRLTGISFRTTVNNRTLAFQLPARAEHVFKLMWEQVRRPRRETKDRVMVQAERTAWKILQDWVAVQVSLIQLEQAELVEVFLPYIYNPDTETTFFQALKQSDFRQLTAGQHNEREDK